MAKRKAGPMVHLSFIKSFVTVVDTGSCKAAAERLFITQPAVSNHIQTLEKNIGAVLFEGKGKKALLTKAGKTFLPYAENILQQYQEAKERATQDIDQVNGTIRIATIYSIGLYRLQSVILKFLKNHPQVNIHLEYHPNTDIYEKILSRKVDFALIAYPKKSRDILVKVFDEEEFVLIQSAQHPVIKKNRLSLADFNQIKFVTLDPHIPTQSAINHFLGNNNISLQVIQAYEHIEILKSAVLLGMGCAIVPKNTVLSELKNHVFKIIDVPELKSLKRPLGLIYHKSKIFTQSHKMFYKTILQE
jgi:LysR family transcriptional regulator, transcriptional activator of the cysJI operon